MVTLPGEKIICELVATDYFLYEFPTRQRTLTLTTHRVRYAETGGPVLKSIMLEGVTSCVLMRKRRSVYFVLWAVLALFSSLVFGQLLLSQAIKQNSAAGIMVVSLGLAVGFVLLLFFFLWRQQVLRITWLGGDIVFVVQGSFDVSVVHAFINDLEAAKNRRFLAREPAMDNNARP